MEFKVNPNKQLDETIFDRSYINEVPDETMIRILELIPQNPLTISSVSKRWSIISQDNVLLKNIIASHFPHIKLPSMLEGSAQTWIKDQIKHFAQYKHSPKFKEFLVKINDKASDPLQFLEALKEWEEEEAYLSLQALYLKVEPEGKLPFEDRVENTKFMKERLELIGQRFQDSGEDLDLDLKDRQLTFLPPEIKYLTRIYALDLGNNQITSLPEEIQYLTKLGALYLGDNFLETLPKEIGKLKRLATLDLNNNRLKSLPEELKEIPLKGLFLNNNRELEDLPKKLEHLYGLYSLEIENVPLTEESKKILERLDRSASKLTITPRNYH